MHTGESSGIFFVILIIWFYLKKNLKNEDFVSLTKIFKLPVLAPKNFKTHIIVT